MQDLNRERGVARENLCRFLAACYYEPGPEFAEEKVFDAMFEAASRIHPDLAACAHRLGDAFRAQTPEDLLVDYARLFLGPNHLVAAPYGSYWLNDAKALMQDSTMAVLELYEDGGFEIDAEFRELPDHIAVELEFLYLLIYRENEARRNDDAKALAEVADLRNRLLNEHLGAWVGHFTAAVNAGAQSAFYREVAEATDRFVKMEAG